jgi:GH25 family lysozyme M1 (1,4-beta-N-acetylmuramidase)
MSHEKKQILLGIAAVVLLLILLGMAAVVFGKWMHQSGLPQIPGLSDSQTEAPVYPEIPLIPMPEKPKARPNPYSDEDFILEDGFMQLVGKDTITGIDVSYYQKEIDWQQVKDFGIQFVIIRLGCRGYETGNLIVDKKVYEYLEGARSVGLKIGAYFYSQAINRAEAVEEALFCLDILDGFQLDMPVAYDWEYVSKEARTANMTGQTLMGCTIAFCETIKAGGYQPMVYFNPHMEKVYLDLAVLQKKGYPFWLAHYTDTMTFPYRVQMWQYSYTGNVPGIEGGVDLNIILP